jgi:3-oxoacyl-[acyl-carrier protein] reductase
MEGDVGRVAVVTGVSRCKGIGFAIAQRLLRDGLSVLIQSWSAHDVTQDWAPGPGELDRVLQSLGGLGSRLDHVELNFEDPAAPGQLIAHAVQRFAAVDVLVVNHAMSAPGGLAEVTAAD